MATDTLVPTSHLFAVSEGAPPVEETERGTWIVRGLKVFRTGTFKDSRGVQKNWTTGDLDKIAENFSALQTVFPNPPVRADHGSSVENVKGFVIGVKRDGEFLLNDIEFTEKDGADKYSRKTYRNRSIEVGPYETNGATPQTLWPAQIGVAFVDIPAVEGLGFRRESTEDPVPEQITFRIRGVETTNVPDVQAYIAELEKRPATTHAFRVAGEDTTDFAKVQAHIETLESANGVLETFRAEQMKVGRELFVDSLVKDKKVAAPQADGLKTYAATLDAAGYGAWVKTFEGAPAIFSSQGSANSGDGGKGDGPSADEQALADLRETVSMHRHGGMALDKLKETESYRKLIAVSPSDAITV